MESARWLYVGLWGSPWGGRRSRAATSGQSLGDMTRIDDAVGRVAQVGASTSRECGSHCGSNVARPGDAPKRSTRRRLAPEPARRVVGAEVHARGADQRRGALGTLAGDRSVTPPRAENGRRGASEPRRRESTRGPDGGESARRSTHPRYPKSERTHPEAPTPKGRLEDPPLASNTPRARHIWFST